MTDQTHRDELEELPPSALLVHRVLEEDQPRTQQEIIDESYLCPRTCRRALERLQDVGLVKSEPKTRDARQELYFLCS